MTAPESTNTAPQPAVGAQVQRPVGRLVPERADVGAAVEAGWLEHGWRPMWEAPKGEGPVMLLVPTRFAHRTTHIQAQGDWLGSYWVIFNADEAVQRIEPDGWRPLHKHPMCKPPNVPMRGSQRP